MINNWERFLPSFLRAHFEKYSRLKIIVENIGWNFIAKAVITVFNVIVVALVTRYLGPANIGIINYVTSFIALFSILANLGIDQVIIYEIKNNPENTYKVLGTSFFIRLFSGSITFIIIAIVSYLTTSPNESIILTLTIIYSLGLVVSAPSVISLYFEAQLLGKYNAQLGLLTNIISNIISIILIILKAKLIFFGLAALLSTVITITILTVFYTAKKNEIKRWEYDKEIAKKLLKPALPLIISSIIFTMWMKVDIIMIKYFLDNAAVGIYSIATHINDFWIFIPAIINSAFFPILVEKRKENIEKYYLYLRKLSELLLLIAIIVGIGAVLFGKIVINFLYGKSFVGSYYVLIIIIWTGIIRCLAIAGFDWVLIEGLVKNNMYRDILGFISNFILNWFFIPIWGIKGAALASLISLCFAFLAGIFSKKLRLQVTKISIPSFTFRELFKKID